MRKLLLAALVFIAAVILLFSVHKLGQKSQTPTVNISREKIATVSEGINAFSIELYKKLSEAPGNIFLSPLSVEFALEIALEGAKGETREEMLSVLHLPKDANTRIGGFAGLAKVLNESGKHKIHLANALWIKEGYRVFNSFKEKAKLLLSEVREIPFDERGVEIINSWVSKHTKGKINRIIETLNPSARVVITNAVYFRALWEKKFEETFPDTFKTPKGEINVEMMYREDVYPYYECAEFQALRMDYDGNRFSMLVVLPREDFPLKKIEEKLSPQFLKELLDGLRETKVRVYFPKFELKTEYKLKGPLVEMGMKHAFSPNLADFSGITDVERLFIEQVYHKAYVKVDEEGTEAAAATAVIIEATAVEPNIPEFRADRPFLFLILDRKTGVILFIGRLENPKT